MRDHDGKITESEALFKLGCKRLSARIHDLRMDGIEIGTAKKKMKNALGESVTFTDYYYLINTEARGDE